MLNPKAYTKADLILMIESLERRLDESYSPEQIDDLINDAREQWTADQVSYLQSNVPEYHRNHFKVINGGAA